MIEHEVNHVFTNRQEAGKLLGIMIAEDLPELRHPETDQLLVGVGRGGILVAGPVARQLHSPLSAFEAETILDLGDCSCEIGAVSSSGFIVYNEDWKCQPGEHGYLGQRVRELSRKTRESQNMWLTQAGLERQPSVSGKRVIIIDDGITSDLIRQAAAITVMQLGAGEVILATPAILQKSKDKLEDLFHAVLSLTMPIEIKTIDDVYQEIQEVQDAEVIHTLMDAAVSLQPAR